MKTSSLRLLCFLLLSTAIIKQTDADWKKTLEEFELMIARARLRVKDLDGIWKGHINRALVSIIKGEKTVTICYTTLSEKCRAAIPPGRQTYTFENGYFTQEYVHLEGIITKEQSANAFPACAKNDEYPVQTKVTVPRSEIVSYNPFKGYLSYHDARKPYTTDCLVLLYFWDKYKLPYVEVMEIVSYAGTYKNFLAQGASRRCEVKEECDFGYEELDEEEAKQEGIEPAYIFNYTHEFVVYCETESCMGTGKSLIHTKEPSALIA
eukprot:g7311.t1